MLGTHGIYRRHGAAVTADITVAAPTPIDLDLTLAISPDTAEIRAAIESELADFLIRDGVPGGTLKYSRLSEAISLAAGEFSHDLISPAADVTYSFGELPVLGTITWVGA